MLNNLWSSRSWFLCLFSVLFFIGRNNAGQTRILDSDSDKHTTVPCDPAVVGPRGCKINVATGSFEKAVYNDDYLIDNPQIAPPTDGTPYGMHVTVDKGGFRSVPESSNVERTAFIWLGHKSGMFSHHFTGACIQFLRSYVDPAASDYNYLSPLLCHVRANKLPPTESGSVFYLNGDGMINSTERVLRTTGVE
jgi:hypothetical protein